jgi:histidine kinase 2/3/4 (cytokinin receptor)
MARKAKWHLPVLAMTADVIQATHEECTKHGVDGYVSKPFEEKQLFQAMKKFLGPSTSS